MPRAPLLVLCLLAAPALAAEPAASRPNDAANTSAAAFEAPKAAAPSARLVPARPTQVPPTWGRLFGIGVVATALVTPGAMALGAWIGTWSNNLYLALIPSMLVVGLVPPVAVVLLEMAVGNALWGSRFLRVPGALLASIGVQLALVVAAVLLGLPGTTVPGIALFTLLDVVLLGGVSSGVMWLNRVEPQAPVAERPGTPPGTAGTSALPKTPTLSVVSASF